MRSYPARRKPKSRSKHLAPLLQSTEEPAISIVDFLRLRIGEDEALVTQVEPDSRNELAITTMGLFEHFGIYISTLRLAAECDWKRGVIAFCTKDTAQLADPITAARLDGRNPFLRMLARVYADHPDFDPEWANSPSGQHRY